MRDQTNQAYQILRQRLLDDIYRPSESLTEVTIAAELGVSRNTVRKALLKLESENLVVIEENKRTRVRSFDVEEVAQYLEVRELLEGLVIRQSIPFIGNSELLEMRTALAQMEVCLKTHDLLEYSQHNWRFHDVVNNNFEITRDAAILCRHLWCSLYKLPEEGPMFDWKGL